MVIYCVIWGWALGASIPKTGNPLYEKIGWVVLVATFIITIVFRKYFYMNLRMEEAQGGGKKKKHDFNLDE